jgi:hypothetical protein
MRKFSPEYHEALTMTAEITLPKAQPSPAHPFAGYVININVATKIHRDPDHVGCLVLVIGNEFEGGELVLYEPGIVLQLKNGDVVLFPSAKVSHLNLHYRGIRASMVLHTDSHAPMHEEGMHGWKGNNHFH